MRMIIIGVPFQPLIRKLLSMKDLASPFVLVRRRCSKGLIMRSALRPMAFFVFLATAHSAAAEAADAEKSASAKSKNAQKSEDLVTVLIEGQSSTAPTAAVGTKIPSTLREVPQTISVITAEDLETRNLVTLDDALKRTAGVTVERTDSHRLNVYSRGFQIEKLQIDGLPTVMDDRVFLAPGLEMFERVEVLKGPAGLLVGAGGAGGAINMVRKAPQSETSVEGKLSVGSWNNLRGTIDATGAINAAGSLRGRAVAVYQDREFHLDVAEQENALLYSVLEYDLGAATVLTFGGSYQTVDARVPWNMPGYYNSEAPVGSQLSLLDVDRSTYLGADWNRDKYNTASVFLELEHKFSNDWNAKLALRHADGALDRVQAYAWGAVDPVVDTIDIYSLSEDYQQKQSGIDIYANGPFNLFGRDHALLIGFNREYVELEQPDFAANGPAVMGDYGLLASGVDIFNPITSFPKPEFIQEGGETFTTGQYGLYTSARLSLTDPLTLVLGGRVSWWKTLYEEMGVDRQKDSFDGEFTPLVGAVYRLNNTYSAYTSYAEIFQPQEGRDAQGELLEALTGRQYEAGIKAEFLDSGLLASFAVFRIEERNRAMDDPTSMDDYSIAAGEVRNDGFEVELNGSIRPGWKVYGGYTYLKTDQPLEAAYDSSPFSAIAPRHSLSLWTNYQLPGSWDKWQVGAGVKSVSEFYNLFILEGAERFEQPGYALVDARVAYDVSGNATVALNASNLLDKEYYERISNPYSGNIYGEPRTFTLSLRLSL